MPAGTRPREQGANAFLGWGLKYLQRSDRAEPGGGTQSGRAERGAAHSSALLTQRASWGGTLPPGMGSLVGSAHTRLVFPSPGATEPGGRGDTAGALRALSASFKDKIFEHDE